MPLKLHSEKKSAVLHHYKTDVVSGPWMEIYKRKVVWINLCRVLLYNYVSPFHSVIMKRSRKVKAALDFVTTPLHRFFFKRPSLIFSKPNCQSRDNVHKFGRKQVAELWEQVMQLPLDQLFKMSFRELSLAERLLIQVWMLPEAQKKRSLMPLYRWLWISCWNEILLR